MKNIINTGIVKVTAPKSLVPTRKERYYCFCPGSLNDNNNNFADYHLIGNWKGSVPIPDQSFEIREQWLHGEDRALFVQFLRRMLCWIPEERPVVEELVFDEFWMQP